MTHFILSYIAMVVLKHGVSQNFKVLFCMKFGTRPNQRDADFKAEV